jgi:hypothetical protein
VIAALALVSLFAPGSALDDWLTPLLARPEWTVPAWLVTFLLGVLFVLAAAMVGATIVGAYLVVSDRLLGWHRNDVFAAQSIIDYRNFLRIRIDNRTGSVEIYPIGLWRVPRKWRARVNIKSHVKESPDGQAPPCYEPGDAELTPHLIEAPIHIRSMSSMA